MTYSHFDDAVDIVRELGTGSHMAKIDIKHAFRICPVEKAQWPLLCYRWQDAFFVDTRLPFGSRSSPYIFNALADLLMWILLFVAGIRHGIHYLDDYFSAAATEDQCKQDMQAMSSTFTELGVPLAPEKITGPTRKITYLGIQIDTEYMTISLPTENTTNSWRSFGLGESDVNAQKGSCCRLLVHCHSQLRWLNRAECFCAGS